MQERLESRVQKGLNVKPMLLTELPLDELNRRVADDEWWLEQKIDGQRLLLSAEPGNIRAFGRNGQVTDVPHLGPHGVGPFTSVGYFIFDGEFLNGTFWVFDLLRVEDLEGGVELTHDEPFWLRRQALEMLFDNIAGIPPSMKLVPVFRSADRKRQHALAIQGLGGEGVVLKHRDHSYQPGKRTRRAMKVKFTKDLDAVVTDVGIDGKENIEVSLFNGRSMIPVGKCSTVGKQVPEPGAVVEVRYLYALHPEMPRLYQPRMIRVRTDKSPAECTIDQVQFTTKKVLEVE